jgi:hypothetical protein
MQFKQLKGKTIISARKMKLKRGYGSGFLQLKFSDGSSCLLVASGMSNPPDLYISDGKEYEGILCYLK